MSIIQFDDMSLVDLLSLIQSTLHQTDSINQSAKQSMASISQSILRFDDELSRVSCMELRINQVNEWMREKGAVNVPDGISLNSSIKLSNNVSNDQLVDVFDAFKQPIVGIKPFPYHIERAYHDLIKLCRRESSLIGAALSICESDGSIQTITQPIQQSSIREGDENIHRSDAPILTQLIHRRHIKQLCKCISRDLFHDELEAALCLTKALDLMYNVVLRRQIQAAHIHSNGHSSHVSPSTTNTMLPIVEDIVDIPSPSSPSSNHIHDHDHQSNQSESDVPRLAVLTSLPHSHSAPMSSPISQPFHQSIKQMNQSVLDHGSVPIKLLFEYNLRYGSTYLNHILVGSLNSVLNSDETMSLDIDLMGPSPTNAQSSPQRSPLSTAQSSDGQTSEDRLFVVCDQLLTAIVSSVSHLPLGIRLLCKKLFELSSNQPIEEILNKPIEQADASAVMSDPSSPFRVCSDYLFLNWIINAIIHPEHYGLMCNPALNHSAQPSIHCPCISQSQRRSLQAVSTVMIKLMSGSMFVFDSGRLIVLNDFLDHWRAPIVNFILEVVNVKERSNPIIVDALSHTMSKAASGDRTQASVTNAEDPVVLLPNDLSCLHGVMRHWCEHKKSERSSPHSHLNNAHLPRDHDIPSSVIQELTKILDQLGDVPDFVGFHDNMYVVLSTGFSDLNIDHSVTHTINRSFDDPQDRLLGDLLCDCLRSLSSIYGTRSSASHQDLLKATDQRTLVDTEVIDLLDCLQLASVRCQLNGQPGSALIADECAEQLGQMSRDSGPDTSIPRLKIYLRTLAMAVTLYWSELTKSSLTSSIVFIESRLQARFDELKHRESVVLRSLHSLQIRRVVDIVYLKLRRLRRFMGTRSEKERGRQTTITKPSAKLSAGIPPSVSSHEPPFMARLTSSTAACSLVWPESVSQDRLLCSACQKALDKKRTLLRSFYTKYLIGEEASSAVVPPSKGSAAPTAHPVVASRSLSNLISASSSTSTVSTPPPTTVGREPGEGYAILDLGLGPNLDLNDPVAYADLMDAVVSSVWNEVRADCARADMRFFVSNDALFHACETRFDVLHALFALNTQHLAVASIPEIIQALAGYSSGHTEIDTHIRALKSPRISQLCLTRACAILQTLPMSYSCRDSLSLLNAVRGILTASLSHPALVSSQAEAGSVDDYMCLLSFVVLRSNPFGLLSHLSTMHALQPVSCSESKSFVDIMTAVKALLELHSSCVLTPSDECIERAKHRDRTLNEKPFALSSSTSFTGSPSSRRMRSMSPVNG